MTPKDGLTTILTDLATLRTDDPPRELPISLEATTAILPALNHHGLTSLVHRVYAGSRPLESSDLLAELSLYRRAGTARWLAHSSALTRLDHALVKHRTWAIILKGLAIGTIHWPEPSLRQSCDIDILVPPGNIEAIRRAFADTGWQQTANGTGKWISAPGTNLVLPPLDVIETPRATNARNPTWRPCIKDLARQSSTISGYAALKTLCPVHALVHAAVHAIDHGASRFSWLLDLVYMTRNNHVSLSEALDHARQAQAHKATLLALSVMHHLFDVPIERTCVSPPWGTRWFVRRILNSPSTWNDEKIGYVGRQLLRAAVVDEPWRLFRI